MAKFPPAPPYHVDLQSDRIFSPITSSAEESQAQETLVKGSLHQLPRKMPKKEPPIDSPRGRVGETLRNPLSIVFGGIQRDPPLFVRRKSARKAEDDDKDKEAAVTALELSIMGSALVLTLGLQVQEVVGSRGGFGNSTQNAEVRFLFVGASALSFALGFYSIVTAAVMLLSIVSTPNMNTKAMLKRMSGWLLAPRMCTLAAAGCLAIKTLIAHFLGLEKSASILGAVVIGIGLLFTSIATAMIYKCLAQFSEGDTHCERDVHKDDGMDMCHDDLGEEDCEASLGETSQLQQNIMSEERVFGNVDRSPTSMTLQASMPNQMDHTASIPVATSCLQMRQR